MKLGTQVGLSPGHTVLDGDPAPPQFSAHICCGQMPGWIKIKDGRKVGHRYVLDGNPAPPLQKGDRAPNFWPMSTVAKRLDRSRCPLVWR